MTIIHFQFVNNCNVNINFLLSLNFTAIQARIISYNEFIADVPISNLSSSIYVNENVGEICLVVLFTGCSERQLNVTLFTADGTALGKLPTSTVRCTYKLCEPTYTTIKFQ